MECQLPEAKRAKIDVDNNSEDKEYRTKKEETGLTWCDIADQAATLRKARNSAYLAWKAAVAASDAFPNNQDMKKTVEIAKNLMEKSA